MTRVAAVQLALNDEQDPATRRHRVRALVGTIDADLIVLPELWEVGPFAVAENLDHAVPLDTWVAHMADLAPGRTIHAGSFLERDGEDLYNTSVVFGPAGEVLATYRKIHLFGFDSGEAVTLSAGGEVVTVQTPLGTTGLATCYDLRFPEMFRALTDAGATAVLIPTGWPAARIGHWNVLAAARATENQVWLLGANSTGVSNGTAMGGHTLVVDPWGEVVGDLQEPGVLLLDLDPDRPARVRAEFPVLRDRRL
ncbi:MAG: nitrilase-related carbon-nitrogen hydrolase [Candidatus Nanopelagicales bacterium]